MKNQENIKKSKNKEKNLNRGEEGEIIKEIDKREREREREREKSKKDNVEI